MRLMVPSAVLTMAIVWASTVEAQPGARPGGPDLKKIESEIQKLKAALEEAEGRLHKAREFGKEKGKFEDKERKERPKMPFGKEGFGKKGWGKEGFDKEGWGKMPPFGKMPFGKEGWGKEKAKEPEKGKTESESIVAQLKKIIASAEKKDDKDRPERRGFGPFGRRPEAEKAAPGGGIEKQLRDIEKTLEEIRSSLRRR